MKAPASWRAAGMRGETGASAVEFALVLPILVLLVFGIMQFSNLLNTYIEVTHLAREGARQGSVGKLSAWTASSPAPPRLASGITIAGSDAVPPGSAVSVTVTYTYPSALNIPLYGTLPVSVQSTATMRRE